MRRRRRRRRTATDVFLTVLWWTALAVFLVSGSVLAVYQLRSGSEKKANETLAAPIQQAISASDSTAVEQAKETLVTENADMIGWVSIENTSLSYPVMYTPSSPEYYLRRAFDKSYALSGTPFLDAACTPDGTGVNSIIYGHNMKNDTMFSVLANYTNQSFWQEHPTVRYERLGDVGTYMIFAVVHLDVDTTVYPNALYAYQSLQGADEATYAAYIGYLKQNSLYDTGATPVFGDTLLTLSTCDNVSQTGRILVCAKRVS